MLGIDLLGKLAGFYQSISCMRMLIYNQQLPTSFFNFYNMQKQNQHFHQKIPLQQLDPINFSDLLEQSARQIFYLNELKLTELQEELNSVCSSSKRKQITVKVYNIFENLTYVFQKLGIEELYNQLRLIFNTIAKMVAPQQSKPKQMERQMKKQSPIDEEITKKQLLKQNKPEFCNEAQKRKSKRQNKARGIFLYNESYSKHVERKIDKQSTYRKKDLLEERDQIDIEDEFERQQMLYFLSRKKQLCILKIKDHSKGYQQIENQFRLVEQRLKNVLQNLQLQFEHENIHQFQFLSKEQISKELLNFNSSMRNQLVVLKQQYDQAIQALRNQNIALRHKITQIVKSRSTMVNSETQTFQTVSSVKKVKRLVEEYQMKIRKLQNKMAETAKKQNQAENKFNTLLAKKDKELVVAYENLSKKEELIKNFKMKCFNYEQIIGKMENQSQEKDQIQGDLLFNLQPQIKNIDFQTDKYRKGKKNFVNNRFNLKRKTFNPNSRQSQYSSVSKSDYGDESEFEHKKVTPFSNKNFDYIQKNNSYEDLKKSFAPKWSKNLKNQNEQGTSIFRKSMRKQSLTYHHRQPSSFANEKIQIQELKNVQGLKNKNHAQQPEKKQTTITSVTELKLKEEIENKIESEKKFEGLIKEVGKFVKRNNKSKSVIQEPNQQGTRLQVIKKNSISVNQSQKNQVIILKKQEQNKQKYEFQTKAVVNKQGAQKFQKNKQQMAKLSKESRFKVKQQMPNLHSQVEDRNIPEQMISKTIEQQNSQPSVARELKKNYQKFITKLNQEQLTAIANKLLKAGKISDQILIQIGKEYPNFLSEMKAFESSRRMYETLNRVHQKKCHQKPCYHLQIFVEFCNKFKEAINNNHRPVLKLHVQNFAHI